MSLVIRVMTTPAFSSVKKSSERRWRWVKTFTRRSFITQAASRPVTWTWARWATQLAATARRNSAAAKATTAKLVWGGVMPSLMAYSVSWGRR